MIANLLERQSVCDQASSTRVSQTVGSMMSGAHTECLQSVCGDVVEAARRNRSKRRHHGQEHLPVDRRSPPDLLKISNECITNRSQQRIDLRLRTLGPRNMQTIVFPIQMLQPQLRDLASAQAVNRHEHENRPISNVGRVLLIQGCKQPSDITPVRTSGQTFQSVDPWPLDAVGEVFSCPVPLSAVATLFTVTRHQPCVPP